MERVIGQGHCKDRRLGYMTETSELACSFSGDGTFQQYIHGNVGSNEASGVELMVIRNEVVDGVRG